MAKLQNNFTTPEQSKKLLELGVPILTSDCYFYIQEINGRNVCDTPNLIPYGIGEYGLRHWWTNRNNARYIPCWSAGRLIEIVDLCTTRIAGEAISCTENYVVALIVAIEMAVNEDDIDFSKLELNN